MEFSVEELVAEALYAASRGRSSLRGFLESVQWLSGRLRSQALALGLAVARNYKFLERAVTLVSGVVPRSPLTLVLAYEAIYRKKVSLSRLSEIARKRNVPLHAGELRRLRSMDPGEVLRGLRGLRRLSIKYSQPLWVVRYFSKLLGFKEMRMLLEAYNKPHPLWIRSRISRHVLLEKIRRRGVAAEADPMLPDAAVVESGSSRIRAGLSRLLVIQDRLSMLAGHVLKPYAGHRVLDTCSAPGGKAAHLYDLLEGRLLIVGADVSWRRLLAEHTLLKNLDVKAELVNMDSGVPALRRGFDSVVLDPDCSSLGRLGHSPETRLWLERMGEGIVNRLSGLQRRLLSSALRLVERGGYVLYTTCTLTFEENEEVIGRFVENGLAELVEHPIRIGDPGLGMPEAQRLYTHKHRSVGGFIALLRVTGF